MMSPHLQRLYNKIELQREKLLESLHAVPGEKLNYHFPGKWSINQIIAHLITAEKLSLQYIKKKILGITEANDSGPVEELKMLLLIATQRMPIKFKAPKVVVEQTPRETNIDKLISEWNKTREDLRDILDRISDRHLKRKIYRHVHLGLFNIQHALKFFGEHARHHQPQIKNLLKLK